LKNWEIVARGKVKGEGEKVDIVSGTQIVCRGDSCTPLAFGEGYRPYDVFYATPAAILPTIQKCANGLDFRN